MAPTDTTTIIDPTRTTPVAAIGSDGWASVRQRLAANTWRTLGILDVPAGHFVSHVMAGVVIPAGQGNVDGAAVDLWCPAVRAGWVPVFEFAKAAHPVAFQGPSAIYARNGAGADVEVDVRFKVEKGRPIAPDLASPYYASRAWRETYYRGIQTLKCPLDLWVMQEILHEVRPDLVIETGTFKGGSALYYADQLDMIDGERARKAEVITIDVEKHRDTENQPSSGWITYLYGSSVNPDMVMVAGVRARGRRTLVVLDSDHSLPHVAAELRAYAPLVSPGSYLVVEDTNNPGPFHAVQDFLASPEGREFEVDRSREKFGITFNPGGWLKRRAGGL